MQRSSPSLPSFCANVLTFSRAGQNAHTVTTLYKAQYFYNNTDRESPGSQLSPSLPPVAFPLFRSAHRSPCSAFVAFSLTRTIPGHGLVVSEGHRLSTWIGLNFSQFREQGT